MTNQAKSQIVTYEANGHEVKLSPTIVDQFITKGNGKVTMNEAFNFMNLCRYSQLNPFLNEAYIVKFGDKPAQMIVGKEAFMKRANRQSQFNGYKAGITVLNSQGDVVKKEGQAVYPNEKLLAGWAAVYRKDIDYPIFVETSLTEYSKGQATWKDMPANMIRKVALVNALREAFPEELGTLYTEDEPRYDESQEREKVQATGSKAKKLLQGFKSPDDEETEKEDEIEEASEVMENANLFEGEDESIIPAELK
ncbi:phage recombination protein Bet [Allofustis seminis]|uniref:phage recombination protein Bet n=1 Tax=Allofustis seminis TaxID=166939 RepID=UPI0003643AB4|nr:phage recombination protein Bet [Allofustis seminis]